MSFYIILGIVEIITVVLLFVDIHLENRDISDEWKIINQERKSLEYAVDKVMTQCKKCTEVYDELIKILKKYIDDESPPNDEIKF